MVNGIERRKINLITIGILVTAFCFIFLIPGASANKKEDFINMMANQVVQGGLAPIRDCVSSTGTSVLKDFYQKCTSGDMSTLLANMGGNTIINMIIACGMVAALVITFIHLIQNLERSQGDTTEIVYKYIVEFFVTLAIIFNADKIMSGVAYLGNQLISAMVSGQSESQTLTTSALINAISDRQSGGVVWFVECFAVLSIPWLLSLAVNVACKFVLIEILFELAIRRVFCPIALADMYAEGIRSPGARYLKKYLAAYLKIAIAIFVAYFITIVLRLISSMEISSLAKIFDFIFTMIAANFAGIGIILKAGELANDIAGG